MINPRAPDYTNTPASGRRPPFTYALEDPAAPPVVSIVTPFYSAGELLHETARSIFNQSFQQWEWLIVNDASPHPRAAEVLAEYRGREPRIRVIDHEVNRGLSAARNTGFRHARCEYVFILDDDDLIEPTTIEKCLWHLEVHPEHSFVNGWSVAFGGMNYLWAEGFNHRERFLEENLAVNRSLIRRSAHERVGGFDESIRKGMEDWDYWVRCADFGLWGGTIPEYFDWYRRRQDHGDRWADLDGAERFAAFRKRLRERYPRLYAGGFPRIEPRWPTPLEPPRAARPADNRLLKPRPRLLMIVPWLAMGGSDKFNIDLLAQLTSRGWEVTVATTKGSDHAWVAEFGRYTPDLFMLDKFLLPADYPVFLRYLIESRRHDVVMISNSEAGYLLLPYLRSFCPGPAYVDFCHSDVMRWKHGGFPRYAVANQDLLDLNVVASKYLKEWMRQRGADPTRIEIAYINIDPEHWRPDPQTAARVRAEYAIRQDQPVIVFTGRVHEDKKPGVLVGVLAELAARGRDFRALIAGDGPELPWLENALMERGLSERATLLGAVTPARVREILAAADVFFLPTIWEGISLSIYEAMACGVPVVSADVGGQRELVTPECGLLVPPASDDREVETYSREIAALLDDPARRREMGRCARERVAREFTLSAMGDRMEALMRRARELKHAHPTPALPERFVLEVTTQAIEQIRLIDVSDGLWAEARDLRERYADLDRRFNELHAWTETLNARFNERSAEVTRLWDQVCALERERAELQRRLAAAETLAAGPAGPGAPDAAPPEDPLQRALADQRELRRILASRSWRIVQALRRIRLMFAPHGSRRERFGLRLLDPRRPAGRSEPDSTLRSE